MRPNKHFNFRQTWAALGVMAVVLAVSLPARAAEPFRIGAFLAVTGQGSFLGAPALATIRLYIQLLNAQGGLLGRKVQLLDYDVGIDPKTAQVAVQRLIGPDRADVIIGGSTTGVTMAVLPLIARAGIPFISLAESAAIIDPVRKWVFKTPPTGRMACARILQDLKNRRITKFALLSGDGGFGRTMRNHCVNLAEPFGLKVVEDQVYKSRSRRFFVGLKRIHENKEVEAVVNVGFGTTPAFITKTFRKLKFTVPLYQSQGAANQDYLDLAGEAAEGVRLPVAPLVLLDRLAENDPVRPVISAYHRFYEKRWGVPPSVFGGYAHDAVQLVVSAVRRGKTFNKEGVRRMIETTSGVIGTSGAIHMSRDNHLGLELNAFRMAEIRGGTWELVE